MSHLIRKSHNVSILLYHFVCPAKYRRALIDKEADQALKEACLDIADRYQVEFLEIETDKDHVHFLVQSVPTYSPMKIIAMIKSLTARKVFARAASVKKQLWAGEFWTDDYYVGTAGQHASEVLIRKYLTAPTIKIVGFYLLPELSRALPPAYTVVRHLGPHSGHP